ncbi:MAG: response regulator [Kofleriaceae bacterium]
MKRSLSVLIAEDNDDDCELLLLELNRNYDVRHRRVQTEAEMRKALATEGWDVVLSDYSMPQFSAPAALSVVKESGLDIPFIIISGTIGEEIAVDALKSGAHDFMVKNRLARLRPAIDRELREVESRRRSAEAEQQQRNAEARFRAIMETAPDGVVSADKDGRINYVNPAGEAMFRYGANELMGAPLTKLMPERYHQTHRLEFERWLGETSARSPGTVELVGLRKDGTEFQMDLSVGTWSNNGGKNFAGIVRDVTDRKKVEAQLLVADRMVSIGTLAAGVAHEINNPLAAVMANLDLAQRDVNELAKQMGVSGPLATLQEEINDARDAAERVRHIVRDLRIFSRGEQEKRGAVDVERVLESTIRMAWNEIRHRARLVKDYGKVGPVEASESRLGQVFLNIVVNAAQAMPEGQADKNEIRVITSEDKKRVYVEVADTGQGIPPEIMRRLFTPFVTTKPIGTGTGLGLSICHRIISELGGEITVSSEVGKGTTFRISLPHAKSSAEIPKIVETSTTKATRRGNILVIDDEPMLAKAVQRALSAEHDVTTFHNAQDALRKILDGARFDVILCDLMMPEMTGMDFHTELRKVAADQADKVIFLTGGAFTPRARQFLDEIANQRVEKPFEAAHLKALINDRIR